MISILGERGAYLTAIHSERGYTGGFSVSAELNIAPAFVGSVERQSNPSTQSRCY
jgi:hypothetical protein